MKDNIPYFNNPGIHNLAPEGVDPLLSGFRLMPGTLPFKLFVFRFNQINAGDGTDFSYEVLMNTIDKDLIIAFGETEGNFVIKTSTGKAIKGYDVSKMVFDSFKYYILNTASAYSVLCANGDKGRWSPTDGIPFSTVDSTGFPVNGASDNQIGYLILFDLEPETLNSQTQTV